MIKKIVLLIVIVITAMSCEGPMGPMGPMGPEGAGAKWDIRYYTIFEKEWKLVGTPGGINSYYTATIKDSRISKLVYDEGAFIVHQIQNFDQPNEVQTALPFVLPIEEDNGSGYTWTEIVSYDYRVGEITFYINYSDFRTDFRSPGDCDFKLTMMW